MSKQQKLLDVQKDVKGVILHICKLYLNERDWSLPKQVLSQLHLWVAEEDYEKLADVSNWFSPIETEGYRTILQVAAFFKKNAAFTNRNVAESAARKSFLAAEQQCAYTNKRIAGYSQLLENPEYATYSNIGSTLANVFRCIGRMRTFIADVLGDYREFRRSLPSRLQFTNGATYQHTKRMGRKRNKLSLRPHTSGLPSKIVKNVIKHFGYQPGRHRRSCVNRVLTVPKSWKTARTIACEPAGFIPFQLAFDSWVKAQLKKRGFDLSDQTRNQRMATEGSISGKFSTIDLSMASDTLAFNVVRWLLPHVWVRYLTTFRSSHYVFSEEPDASPTEYHKFSSMGNGYTFALETLIFAAACYGVNAKEFMVYGDDLVVRTEDFKAVSRCLRWLGFKVNSEKSFDKGSFRESCGVNAFKGVDVTPFYIRQWPAVRPVSARRQKGVNRPVLCHNVNGLLAIAEEDGPVYKFVCEIIRTLQLKATAFSSDSLSGVWIHPSFLRGTSLLKHRNSQRYSRAYVSKFKRVAYVPDSRELFLWFHSKLGEQQNETLQQRLARAQLGEIPKSVRHLSSVPISEYTTFVSGFRYRTVRHPLMDNQSELSFRVFGHSTPLLRDCFSDLKVGQEEE